MQHLLQSSFFLGILRVVAKFGENKYYFSIIFEESIAAKKEITGFCLVFSPQKVARKEFVHAHNLGSFALCGAFKFCIQLCIKILRCCTCKIAIIRIQILHSYPGVGELQPISKITYEFRTNFSKDVQIAVQLLQFRKIGH